MPYPLSVSYIMGITANFRAIWNNAPYTCNATIAGQCDATQAAFISSWATKTFNLQSESAANTIAAAYAAYFNVPYLNQGYADNYITDSIQTIAQSIGNATGSVNLPKDSFDWAASAKVMCAAYQNVSSLVIPANVVQAYRTTVLNSIGFHCYGATALAAVLVASQQYSAGQIASAVTSLQSALSALTTITSIQRDAEGVRFRGLFSHDNLSCGPNARREVLEAIARLSGSATMRAQASTWSLQIDLFACQHYGEMYAYQFAFGNKSFPLMNSDPASNMYLWPQAFCTLKFPSTDGSSDWCLPNPEGGTFGRSATITLKSAHGGPVRYTTDGTLPTSLSPIASGPITITSTTVIAVALADENAGGDVPPTIMTFVRVE